jgi:hypothetical protein
MSYAHRPISWRLALREYMVHRNFRTPIAPMPAASNRIDREHYNSVNVGVRLAAAAGSTAWSPAGRGSCLRQDYGCTCRAFVDLADRSLPIVFRN